MTISPRALALGRFTPANGSDNRDVVSQDLDPFDCRSASTDVRVTHE